VEDVLGGATAVFQAAVHRLEAGLCAAGGMCVRVCACVCCGNVCLRSHVICVRLSHTALGMSRVPQQRTAAAARRRSTARAALRCRVGASRRPRPHWAAACVWSSGCRAPVSCDRGVCVCLLVCVCVCVCAPQGPARVCMAPLDFIKPCAVLCCSSTHGHTRVVTRTPRRTHPP
jgi:hypothetical protein